MSIILALMLAVAEPAAAPAGPEPFEPQGFRHSLSFEINAPRAEVFAAATGDVSRWWDHRFTADPAELVIEPVFGGRFYERFTEGSDDGALHATVIYVNAPQALRLDGPFGLSGRAVTKLVSWRWKRPMTVRPRCSMWTSPCPARWMRRWRASSPMSGAISSPPA